MENHGNQSEEATGAVEDPPPPTASAQEQSTSESSSQPQQQQERRPPPPLSPLTGSYLLIVVGEPHSERHKEIILQKIAKAFLSWEVNECHVSLEKELQVITGQSPEGEEARYGERLIQYATENLVTEILIHPQLNTLHQCLKNLLSSFTKHRHIIHAGYTFAGNGSWILQDGTLSISDLVEALHEPDVLRVLKAYENSVSIDVHCAPEGDWTTERFQKEPVSKLCNVRVNPSDVMTAGNPAISAFIDYLSPFLEPANIQQLLQPTDVVGNIRFTHPTLYVFPGGQGDAALFGINGFNMLIDGGFARKACFWDFARHLDRLDAVLLTRLNNSTVNGISAVLQRKKMNHVYPQIGHFFCNLQDRKIALSPDGDKDKDSLIVNLAAEGQEIVANLRHLALKPHPCYRDGNQVDPVNLYHKVGHGKLDMYVISPARDSQPVREFLAKWGSNDSHLFSSTGRKIPGKAFEFPLQNLVSICALLVWQPANPNDTITRILFPGSTPQHKIFEGLEKLRHLEFLKHPVCSAKSISPSVSTTTVTRSLSKTRQTKPAEYKQKEAKIVSKPQVKPGKPKTPPKDLKTKLDNKLADEKNAELENIEEPLKKLDNRLLSKDEQIENIKKEIQKIEQAESEEQKKKIVHKSKYDMRNVKSKVDSRAPSKSIDRKKPQEKKPEGEASPPTTPKKALTNGTATKAEKAKMPGKPTKVASPTSTPAKSAKEANNRKVVEARVTTRSSSKSATRKKEETPPLPGSIPAKVERKPISRRPKAPPSPVKTWGKLPKPDTESGPKKVIKKTAAAAVAIAGVTAVSQTISKELQKGAETEKTEVGEGVKEVKKLEEETTENKETDTKAVKKEPGTEEKCKEEEEEEGEEDEEEEEEEYLIITKEEYEEEKEEEEARTEGEGEMKKLMREEEESEKKREMKEKAEDEVKEARTEETEQKEKEKDSNKEEKVIGVVETPEGRESELQRLMEVDEGIDLKEPVSKEHKDGESLPEEKMSNTLETSATTAPTLPEDERIEEPPEEQKEQPEEVKEVIEEKYIQEETKEEKREEPEPEPEQPNVPTTIDVEGSPVLVQSTHRKHPRDVVKTPDEVAELPVHEEVDPRTYGDFQKELQKKPDEEKREKPDFKATVKGEANFLDEDESEDSKKESSREPEAEKNQAEESVITKYLNIIDELEKSATEPKVEEKRKASKPETEKASDDQVKRPSIQVEEVDFPPDMGKETSGKSTPKELEKPDDSNRSTPREAGLSGKSTPLEWEKDVSEKSTPQDLQEKPSVDSHPQDETVTEVPTEPTTHDLKKKIPGKVIPTHLPPEEEGKVTPEKGFPKNVEVLKEDTSGRMTPGDVTKFEEKVSPRSSPTEVEKEVSTAPTCQILEENVSGKSTPIDLDKEAHVKTALLETEKDVSGKSTPQDSLKEISGKSTPQDLEKLSGKSTPQNLVKEMYGKSTPQEELSRKSTPQNLTKEISRESTPQDLEKVSGKNTPQDLEKDYEKVSGKSSPQDLTKEISGKSTPQDLEKISGKSSPQELPKEISGKSTPQNLEKDIEKVSGKSTPQELVKESSGKSTVIDIEKELELEKVCGKSTPQNLMKEISGKSTPQDLEKVSGKSTPQNLTKEISRESTPQDSEKELDLEKVSGTSTPQNLVKEISGKSTPQDFEKLSGKSSPQNLAKEIPRKSTPQDSEKELDLEKVSGKITPQDLVKEISGKSTPQDLEKVSGKSTPQNLTKEISRESTPQDSEKELDLEKVSGKITPQDFVKEISGKSTPQDFEKVSGKSSPQNLAKEISRESTPQDSEKELDLEKGSGKITPQDLVKEISGKSTPQYLESELGLEKVCGKSSPQNLAKESSRESTPLDLEKELDLEKGSGKITPQDLVKEISGKSTPQYLESELGLEKVCGKSSPQNLAKESSRESTPLDLEKELDLEKGSGKITPQDLAKEISRESTPLDLEKELDLEKGSGKVTPQDLVKEISGKSTPQDFEKVSGKSSPQDLAREISGKSSPQDIDISETVTSKDFDRQPSTDPTPQDLENEIIEKEILGKSTPQGIEKVSGKSTPQNLMEEISGKSTPQDLDSLGGKITPRELNKLPSREPTPQDLDNKIIEKEISGKSSPEELLKEVSGKSTPQDFEPSGKTTPQDLTEEISRISIPRNKEKETSEKSTSLDGGEDIPGEFTLQSVAEITSKIGPSDSEKEEKSKLQSGKEIPTKGLEKPTSGKATPEGTSGNVIPEKEIIEDGVRQPKEEPKLEVGSGKTSPVVQKQDALEKPEIDSGKSTPHDVVPDRRISVSLSGKATPSEDEKFASGKSSRRESTIEDSNKSFPLRTSPDFDSTKTAVPGSEKLDDSSVKQNGEEKTDKEKDKPDEKTPTASAVESSGSDSGEKDASGKSTPFSGEISGKVSGKLTSDSVSLALAEKGTSGTYSLRKESFEKVSSPSPVDISPLSLDDLREDAREKGDKEKEVVAERDFQKSPTGIGKSQLERVRYEEGASSGTSTPDRSNYEKSDGSLPNGVESEDEPEKGILESERQEKESQILDLSSGEEEELKALGDDEDSEPEVRKDETEGGIVGKEKDEKDDINKLVKIGGLETEDDPEKKTGVKRMLVTASSEDGGTETEICLKGEAKKEKEVEKESETEGEEFMNLILQARKEYNAQRSRKTSQNSSEDVEEKQKDEEEEEEEDGDAEGEEESEEFATLLKQARQELAFVRSKSRDSVSSPGGRKITTRSETSKMDDDHLIAITTILTEEREEQEDGSVKVTTRKETTTKGTKGEKTVVTVNTDFEPRTEEEDSSENAKPGRKTPKEDAEGKTSQEEPMETSRRTSASSIISQEDLVSRKDSAKIEDFRQSSTEMSPLKTTYITSHGDSESLMTSSFYGNLPTEDEMIGRAEHLREFRKGKGYESFTEVGPNGERTERTYFYGGDEDPRRSRFVKAYYTEEGQQKEGETQYRYYTSEIPEEETVERTRFVQRFYTEETTRPEPEGKIKFVETVREEPMERLDFAKAIDEHVSTRGEYLGKEYQEDLARYGKTKGESDEAGTSGSKTEGKKDVIEGWGKPLGLPLPPKNTKAYAFPGQNISTTSTLSTPTDNSDSVSNWGHPMNLPSPAPPPAVNETVETPVKAINAGKETPEKKIQPKKNVLGDNKSSGTNTPNRRSESPVKQFERRTPSTGRSNKTNFNSHVYLDLTYVPHHGNSYYSNVEFFKRVRARYYVFSGTEPSKEVYNALLEAKQTWEDKKLEVTIIPTYDTDVLGYWVAENEEVLAKHKIDLSPSASRCTINLQDHETSCSAYRLEF